MTDLPDVIAPWWTDMRMVAAATDGEWMESRRDDPRDAGEGETGYRPRPEPEPRWVLPLAFLIMIVVVALAAAVVIGSARATG